MHRRLILEQPVSRAAIWSRRLALFSLTVVVLAVLIFRFGTPSFARLAPVAGAYLLVLLALLLSVVAFARIWQDGHRGVGIAAQAFVLCLLLLLPVGYLGLRMATLPFVDDVSTDIAEPPAFGRSSAVLAGRGGLVPPDPAPERRAAQRRGYPRALPIVLEEPADAAFALARKTAEALGWRVLEALPPGGRSGTGRIDAVATSRITGLVEDITIRIRPRADGARIDLRSASRLRGFDFGANARRIADFDEEIRLLLEGR
jgi:hypothetical protein